MPSIEDFKNALTYQKIARSPSDTLQWFLSADSPTNWKRAWDATKATLSDTGKGEDVPVDTRDFRADELFPLLQQKYKTGK